MLSTLYGIQGLAVHVAEASSLLHPGHPGIDSELGHGMAHLAIACAVLGPVVAFMVVGFLDRARGRS
ncbi:MAG: hypothetical protein ACPHRO_02260 [Nannocystaceae bacterium]